MLKNKNSSLNLIKRFEKTGLKVISSLVDITGTCIDLPTSPCF